MYASCLYGWIDFLLCRWVTYLLTTIFSSLFATIKLIVDSYQSMGYQGAAYVYTKTGSSTVTLISILYGTPTYYSQFGTSVSVFQDTIVIGAPYASK